MKQRFYKVKAKSLDDAYRSLRARFGDDAVVVDTNQMVEGGFLGMLGTKRVELTVAVEEKAKDTVERRVSSAVERRYADQSRPHVVGPPMGTGSAVGGDINSLKQVVQEAQARMNAPLNIQPRMDDTVKQPRQDAGTELDIGAGASTAPLLQFPQEQATTSSERESALRKEVQEIREMMQVLYTEQPGSNMPREFAPHYRLLVDRGLSRRNAAELIGRVARSGDPVLMQDSTVFAEQLFSELCKVVKRTGGLSLQQGVCRRVALCGATGVGKTTNIAKIAARFAVKEHARVALVTADTYRIAASEQLRVYANIIGIPIVVVNNENEMVRALGEFTEYDLVLIDTPGGSQYNLEQINELKGIMEAAAPDETILVLGAGTPLMDMHHVVNNFMCLNPTSLMFSKLDETRQYGAMLSLSLESRMPLSYVSVGQNVPDDIRIVSPELVASLILEGKV